MILEDCLVAKQFPDSQNKKRTTEDKHC